MDRRTAKEFLHLRDWLQRAREIVQAGRDAYISDPLRQEAGDSLMMKIGEAANRLSRAGVEAPVGVRWADANANRNWLIHQYDQIDRDITWATLEQDLAAWRAALADRFTDAEATLPLRLLTRQAGPRPATLKKLIERRNPAASDQASEPYYRGRQTRRGTTFAAFLKSRSVVRSSSSREMASCASSASTEPSWTPARRQVFANRAASLHSRRESARSARVQG